MMSLQKKIPNTRTMVPKILEDMRDWLKKYNIQISEAVEGEGRGGSLKDEGSIKKALWISPYKDMIIDQKVRKAGDILVRDYDGTSIYLVNIKTSLGGSDNCFSKCGIVYALTNITLDELPSKMNFNQMNNLLKKHKEDIPEKDYWFLCLNKKDSSEILIRGAKQINNWVININPNNILQVNWKKEKLCEPVTRTYDEAYEAIIGGAKKSLNTFWKEGIPEEWKWECNTSNTE